MQPWTAQTETWTLKFLTKFSSPQAQSEAIKTLSECWGGTNITNNVIDPGRKQIIVSHMQLKQ